MATPGVDNLFTPLLQACPFEEIQPRMPPKRPLKERTEYGSAVIHSHADRIFAEYEGKIACRPEIKADMKESLVSNEALAALAALYPASCPQAIPPNPYLFEATVMDNLANAFTAFVGEYEDAICISDIGYHFLDYALRFVFNIIQKRAIAKYETEEILSKYGKKRLDALGSLAGAQPTYTCFFEPSKMNWRCSLKIAVGDEFTYHFAHGDSATHAMWVAVYTVAIKLDIVVPESKAVPTALWRRLGIKAGWVNVCECRSWGFVSIDAAKPLIEYQFEWHGVKGGVGATSAARSLATEKRGEEAWTPETDFGSWADESDANESTGTAEKVDDDKSLLVETGGTSALTDEGPQQDSAGELEVEAPIQAKESSTDDTRAEAHASGTTSEFPEDKTPSVITQGATGSLEVASIDPGSSVSPQSELMTSAGPGTSSTAPVLSADLPLSTMKRPREDEANSDDDSAHKRR